MRPREHVPCRTPADVAEALALSRTSGLALAVRSGGHCFAGRSSTEGVLVDVGPMDSVSVGDGTVTVGAGALLGAIYDALAPHGRTIAAGCGPTVGIAGLALGGGLGILGRTHGLTCDQLVSARAVLADGRVVDCDERREPDLFWALRGAGGGQFGVVTSLVLRTVPAPPATTLHLQWPFRDGAAVLGAWQEWAPDAPDALAASLLVTAGAEPRVEPVVHVFGAMAGGRADASAQLDELVARAGADPAHAALHELPYREAKRRLATHAPAEDASPDALGRQKSEFFRRTLPPTAIAALLDHVAAGRRAGELRVLDLSPWGGAYNRVAEDATAFAHRGERFVVKHDVVIAPGAGAAGVRRARDWLARSWELVHPWGAGRVYANFPDPDLDDPLTAYHAGNLDRLIRVKAAYDPGDVFRFAQSVPTSRA
ncbi:MAG TPA: FAD-binding oxidoreductase [Solirubrobacteraceae bacterium]|nr:FAD-binding oxidoreductase [Solirubrobacteraceae bacterium]